MTREEIRSTVRNSLPRIDKTQRFHDNFIDAACEKAISELLDNVWGTSPLNLQRYTKGFGYDTPIPVQLETATGIYYSTLPEMIVPFQDKASGVRRISTITQGGITFFPMDFREIDLASNGSYFDTVTSKIGYAVNQTRVEYYKMTTAVASVGVRMDLIIPFSRYYDTDTVLIPEKSTIEGSGYHMLIETFMDKVLKILGVATPINQKDDNSDQNENNKVS